MQPYHVRRTDRELSAPEDLASILRRGKYATIAMVQDGEPYVVTLSYGHDAERGALYFHVAREGRKLDAIAADPRACATIIVDGGYEQGACKHHYQSLVLTGRMAVVTDEAETRHAMRVLVGHLENDPVAVWDRNKLELDAPWKRLHMLRLDIDTMTGKAGS